MPPVDGSSRWDPANGLPVVLRLVGAIVILVAQLSASRAPTLESASLYPTVHRVWFTKQVNEHLRYLTPSHRQSTNLSPIYKECGLTPAYNYSQNEGGYDCPKVARAEEKEFNPANLRIAGGFAPQKGAFPSFARLEVQFNDNTNTTCGGTLINSRMVITAAHCLMRVANVTSVKVRLGVVDAQEDTGVAIMAAGQCIIKGYEHSPVSFLTNDVALIVWLEPVKYSPYIQAACIDFTKKPREDATCLTVGMGKVDRLDKKKTKMYALPVKKSLKNRDNKFTDRSCYKSFSPKLAGVPCEGDSGGPTYCLDKCGPDIKQYVVAGTSYGSGSCIAGRHQDFCSADYNKIGQSLEKMINYCGVSKHSVRASPELYHWSAFGGGASSDDDQMVD